MLAGNVIIVIVAEELENAAEYHWLREAGISPF
jgi:hypothetical protein